MIDRFNIFEARDAYQIVSRDLNPTRAKYALAPGPEALITALIHTMRDAEGEAFERGKHGKFFGHGINESRLCLVELRLSAGKTLDSFRQFEIAALPPHSAESLWLSGPSKILERGYASAGGVASQNIHDALRKGRAFPQCAAAKPLKNFSPHAIL